MDSITYSEASNAIIVSLISKQRFGFAKCYCIIESMLMFAQTTCPSACCACRYFAKKIWDYSYCKCLLHAFAAQLSSRSINMSYSSTLAYTARVPQGLHQTLDCSRCLHHLSLQSLSYYVLTLKSLYLEGTNRIFQFRNHLTRSIQIFLHSFSVFSIWLVFLELSHYYGRCWNFHWAL